MQHAPSSPSAGIIFQTRDYAIISSLATHRYLRSDHVHALQFAGSSVRVAQRRLRLLWQHEYVDRLFVPAVLDGRHQPLIPPRQPIYTLTPQGAALVAERTGTDQIDRIPHLKPAERPSAVSTLEHHLVVSEFLVAVAVACRDSSDFTLHQLDHEWALWQQLAASKKERQGSIVPDGAFTFRLSNGALVSFAVEVVRANTKSGNHTLRAKLARYAELNRSGFFRDAYGFDRLRAVLVLTTTDARAQSLRSVAATLPQSRGLFWFASYLLPEQDQFAISPDSLFSYSWTIATGERTSLAAALAHETSRPCTNSKLHDRIRPASSSS